MINKIITKNQEISNFEEGISIDFILKRYRTYLSEGNKERKDQNNIAKAITQFNLFLQYILEHRNGIFGKGSFNIYTQYLQQLVDNDVITSSQKAMKRMYARRINLSNDKEGYLVWMYDHQYFKIVKDKVLLENNWSKKFEDWLSLQSKLTRKTAYGKTISNIVGVYLNWLKKSDYKEISALSVNTFLREQAHLKISTLNLYLKAIKRFAVYFEQSSDHPQRHAISKEIQSLKKFEDSLQTVTRIGLNNAHIEFLFKEANDKQQLILHLGVGMGLRGSSMLHLKVNDINFENKRMAVWLKGKNNKTFLPIPPSVLRFISDYIKVKEFRNEDTLLNYSSEAISSLSKYFSDFLHKIDLKEIEKEGELYPISLHTLRHTFAYNSLDKFGLLTTSKLLGHASTQITEQYYLQDKVRDILNSIYKEEDY